MQTVSETEKARLLEQAEAIIERFKMNRLASVPLLYTDCLPAISGIYIAVNDQRDVLYVGETKDFTQRCNLRSHHKLPKAVEEGATTLLLASVSEADKWYVEQVLIDQFNPPLNGSLERWWIPKIDWDELLADVEQQKETDRIHQFYIEVDSATPEQLKEYIELCNHANQSPIEFWASNPEFNAFIEVFIYAEYLNDLEKVRKGKIRFCRDEFDPPGATDFEINYFEVWNQFNYERYCLHDEIDPKRYERELIEFLYGRSDEEDLRLAQELEELECTGQILES